MKGDNEKQLILYANVINHWCALSRPKVAMFGSKKKLSETEASNGDRISAF